MQEQEKEKKRRLLEALINEVVEDALEEHSILYEQYDYSHDMLYKAFIEPFTDIWKSAQHGAEKIIATASSEAGTLAKQLAFLLIPFIKPDAGSLKNMAAQDRQRLASRLGQIDGNFKDVLDRNWQTLNNLDVWGTLFLMHPQLAIGQKIAAKAPEVALQLMASLTGGNEAIQNILNSYRQMKTGGGRVQASPYQADYSSYEGYSTWGQDAGGGGYGGDFGGFEESIEEQVSQQGAAQQPQQPRQAQQQAPAQGQPQGQPQRPPVNPNVWAKQQIAKLLKDPTIKKQMTTSKLAKTMQAEAVKYIVKAAQKDLGFNFGQLKAKAGPNFAKIMSQLEKTLGPEAVQNIETNPEMQKRVVEEIKKVLKPVYIKQLETLLQTNPAARQAVSKGIQQIQAL